MNVLLLGADGFLGRHLQIALETAGHTVRRGVHRPVRRADEIAVDYARDVDPGAWRGRLTGVDAVINTVGILREGRGRRFDAIHDQAPRALFAACREAGVRRVIQVSALGADAGAAIPFRWRERDVRALRRVPGRHPSVERAGGLRHSGAREAWASLRHRTCSIRPGDEPGCARRPSISKRLPCLLYHAIYCARAVEGVYFNLDSYAARRMT